MVWLRYARLSVRGNPTNWNQLVVVVFVGTLYRTVRGESKAYWYEREQRGVSREGGMIQALWEVEAMPEIIHQAAAEIG